MTIPTPRQAPATSGKPWVASWADLLLIATLTTIGIGLCALGGLGATLIMSPRAPKESVLRDSLGVALLEQNLATAREDRNFMLAHRREVGMRLMQAGTALRMTEADLGALPAPTRRADSLRRDSITQARATLQRSIRVDSLIAFQLASQIPVLDDAVDARAHRLDLARDSLDRAVQWAKAKHGAFETMLSTLVTVLAFALLLLAAARMMRPRAHEPGGLHPALVVRATTVLVGMFLIYQLGGLLLTVGVGALATITFILWNTRHAPT